MDTTLVKPADNMDKIPVHHTPYGPDEMKLDHLIHLSKFIIDGFIPISIENVAKIVKCYYFLCIYISNNSNDLPAHINLNEIKERVLGIMFSEDEHIDMIKPYITYYNENFSRDFSDQIKVLDKLIHNDPLLEKGKLVNHTINEYDLFLNLPVPMQNVERHCFRNSKTDGNVYLNLIDTLLCVYVSDFKNFDDKTRKKIINDFKLLDIDKLNKPPTPPHSDIFNVEFNGFIRKINDTMQIGVLLFYENMFVNGVWIECSKYATNGYLIMIVKNNIVDVFYDSSAQAQSYFFKSINQNFYKIFNDNHNINKNIIYHLLTNEKLKDKTNFNDEHINDIINNATSKIAEPNLKQMNMWDNIIINGIHMYGDMLILEPSIFLFSTGDDVLKAMITGSSVKP